MLKISTERKLHTVFIISLILKTLHAVFEVVAGILFLFVNKAMLDVLVWLATIGEIEEDPHDFLAHYAINSADKLSGQGLHFIAYYLLGHGAIKLVALILLWREKLWAYPLSIAVFIGFIVYQLHRYSSTHSVWLLVFTALDVLVVILTVHEYLQRRPQVEHR